MPEQRYISVLAAKRRLWAGETCQKLQTWLPLIELLFSPVDELAAFYLFYLFDLTAPYEKTKH